MREGLARVAAELAGATIGPGLARHVRGCAACCAHADALVSARAWLDEQALPVERPGRAARAGGPPSDDLERRARRALARELSARLARDLADSGRGRPVRDARARRRDLQRLAFLLGRQALHRPPWPAVAATLAADPPAALSRGAALQAAARLDPHGLDLALAHLGQLVRDGARAESDARADALLARLA